VHQVPSDRAVPLSVNRGKPAVLAEESADFSKAMRVLAKAVIPKPPVPQQRKKMFRQLAKA